MNFRSSVRTTLTISAILFQSLFVFSQEKLYHNEFPLSDVVLLDGPFNHARTLNIKVLLEYDVDGLLAGYRKEAGLPAKAKSFSNWDGLDGHVGGHYLSALAMNTATGSVECKKRMQYVIAELKSCQAANAKKYPEWGIGYVGAVPNSEGLWPKIKGGDIGMIWKYWVPWYNVHKTYAGLRDAWLYTGNKDAKAIFLNFCNWAINLTAGLSDEQMEKMLDNEQGGMNEIFADAYQITANKKYLTAAKRFSHKALLTPMADGRDNLDNKHANTQVPKAVGFERIGELSGEKKYLDAGEFFWHTVTGTRTLAFGGNSRREFFPGTEAGYDFIRDLEGPESCNSNNMLKLTEDVFRINPLAQYADYYERTVLNHILSTQHPEHGGYVYFTPVRPLSYRVYSAPDKAMWCCVGTGMENHGKYNQFIYTHRNDSLYLNLFLASKLTWKEKGLTLTQETEFPYEEQTKITITQGNAPVTLMVRYPSWVAKGELKITVNDKTLIINQQPSSYVAVRRQWKKGDVIRIALPMHNTVERLPNLPSYVAIMHGPVLLGAKTPTEDLNGFVADEGRWSHIPGRNKVSIAGAPVLIADDPSKVAASLVPVSNKPLHFNLGSLEIINPLPIELEPFYGIHDSRYMMYWMALSKPQFNSYKDSIQTIEREQTLLDNITVDRVLPGEQQPEADHEMQSENSKKGVIENTFFREASSGGYFSYNMRTKGYTGLVLRVRYWGAEWGDRKFDIYIDNQKLVSENLTGRWNQSRFFVNEYAIPGNLVTGKQTIRVKFQSLQGASAGPVYEIRLVREKGEEGEKMNK